jgi:ABC-type transport system involved in multi-copper enzyme maturation permease subunit
MILHVIRKEILHGFLSLRLPFTLLLVTAVMASTAFLFLEDYQQQLADYNGNIKDNLQKVSQRADGSWLALANVFSRNHQWVYRTPTRLAFLAAGHEKNLPNAFEVNAFSIQSPTKRFRGNYFLRWSEDMDWAFVISVIMSFAAIVLVYDSISGERESGTLRLSMSNPVPRSTVILGKYIGAVVMLIIPLLVGMLVSMIIITVSGKINLAGADWVRILVTILLSLLYLSIFIALGLFVSSSLRSSAASLVLLLLAWTVIVVVIPGVAGTITTRLSKLPDSKVFEQSVSAAFHNAHQEYITRHPESASWQGGRWDPRDSLGKHFAFYDATMALYRDYWDQMAADVRSGYSITRISPCVVYRRAVESIAGSGVDHYESFMNQVWRYKSVLRDFLISHHPLDYHQQYDYRKAREVFSEVKFGAADVPKFHERPVTIEEGMWAAVWDVLFLFLFSLLFFMGSVVAFLRYDVR